MSFYLNHIQEMLEEAEDQTGFFSLEMELFFQFEEASCFNDLPAS